MLKGVLARCICYWSLGCLVSISGRPIFHHGVLYCAARVPLLLHLGCIVCCDTLTVNESGCADCQIVRKHEFKC
jgi:hypothetical protein